MGNRLSIKRYGDPKSLDELAHNVIRFIRTHRAYDPTTGELQDHKIDLLGFAWDIYVQFPPLGYNYAAGSSTTIFGHVWFRTREHARLSLDMFENTYIYASRSDWKSLSPVDNPWYMVHSKNDQLPPRQRSHILVGSIEFSLSNWKGINQWAEKRMFQRKLSGDLQSPISHKFLWNQEGIEQADDEIIRDLMRKSA